MKLIKQLNEALVIVLTFYLAGFFYFSEVQAVETTILINEVAWMGTLESANSEWLELKNLSETEIDLTNWVLRAIDGSPVINLAGKIPASGYFLLERTDDDTLPAVAADQIYVGSLSNTGEDLELVDANGAVVDSIDATGENGLSADEAGWPAGDNTTKATMERKVDLTWQTSAAAGGTPKAVNSSGLVVEPEAVATTTPNNTSNNQPTGGTTSATEETTVKKSAADEPIINELLPDPVGPDDLAEFIELFNPNDNEIDLSGWRLNTKLGSFEFKASGNTSIKANGYLTLRRTLTRLPLSNLDDTIKLYSSAGKLIDSVKYKKPAVGNSYCLDDDDKWQWCRRPTPGAKNYYNAPPRLEVIFPKEARAGAPVVFDSSDIFDPEGKPLTFSWDFGDGTTNELMTAEHTFLQPGNYVVRLTAGDEENEVREEATIKVLGPNGEKIVSKTASKTKTTGSAKKVAGIKTSAVKKTSFTSNGKFLRLTGVVAVPPGILGVQIFYLAGEKNIQVYNYSKSFPELKIGDYVEVTGELTSNAGEPRLKTRTAADIKVLGVKEPPEPEEIACRDLSDEQVGKLVQLKGELTKKTGSTIYLDDSTDEAQVYLKPATGISIKNLNEGEELTVTGIVSKTASGLRLLPRSLADIEQAQAAEALPGSVSTATEWQLEPRDKQAELLKYLLVIAGGVILVLIGMLVKYRKTKIL
jgi:PKD repeat protein